MTTVLAILCFVTAGLLAGPGPGLNPIGPHSRALGRRLSRLVPAALASGAADSSAQARAFLIFQRMLKAVDPSFPTFEAGLTSLGVTSPTWTTWLECAKLATILATACLTAVEAPRFVASPIVDWMIPPLLFLTMMLVVNRTVRRAAARRRTRIRSELAPAVEILSIFLESGQSLDQAFRGFCDISGDALPRIAAVQRVLVSDMDNGVSYEKAIERWANNLGIEDAKPLAALFIDSLVHGTELVSHLRQIADDLVEQRIFAARASIGVKSAQLSGVMVVFFLPAVLAFVGAPAAIALFSALGPVR